MRPLPIARAVCLASIGGSGGRGPPSRAGLARNGPAGPGPVDMPDLLGSTEDAVQARRCLDSLLADGLVERAHDGWFVLPGTAVAG